MKNKPALVIREEDVILSRLAETDKMFFRKHKYNRFLNNSMTFSFSQATCP